MTTGLGNRRETANSSGNTGVSAFSGHIQATDPADHRRIEPIDPDLQALVDAWLTLPAAVKAGILAMVRASNPNT